MQDIMRQNVVAGALYLIFGLLMVFVLIPLGIDEPSNVQFPPLAPSYWPRIICLGLAALGASMLVRSFLQNRAGSVSGESTESDSEGEDSVLWRASAVIGLGFALYAVLETLGFVVSTAIALVILMLFANERRPQIIVPVSLGVPLALYFFFTKAASIPIPNGILETLMAGG